MFLREKYALLKNSNSRPRKNWVLRPTRCTLLWIHCEYCSDKRNYWATSNLFFFLPCDSVRFIEYRKDVCRKGWLRLMCCHWNGLAHFTNGRCKIVCCRDACQNGGFKRKCFFCLVASSCFEEMCDWVKNQCDVYHNNNNCAGRTVTTMTVFSPGHP